METYLRLALKTLIVDNAETLTQDLTLQGAGLELGHVTISGTTPPSFFPHIAIIALDQGKAKTSANVRNGMARERYDILIGLLSQAELDPRDQESYERSDMNHQLLGDRIMALIDAQEWLTYENVKFGLERTQSQDHIQKTNNGVVWETDTGIISRLSSEIRFTVLLNCIDESKLYEQI